MAPTEYKRTETTTLKVIVVLAVSRMAGSFALMMMYSDQYVTFQYVLCYLFAQKKKQ